MNEISQITALMWDGERSQALTLLSKAIQDSMSRIATLENEVEKEHAHLETLRSMMPENAEQIADDNLLSAWNRTINKLQKAQVNELMLRASPKETTRQIAVRMGVNVEEETEEKLTPSQRDRRRFQILQLAKSMTPSVGDVLDVNVMALRLPALKIEMGIPRNRYVTAIASILSKSDNFESVGIGQYRRTKVQAIDAEDL